MSELMTVCSSKPQYYSTKHGHPQAVFVCISQDDVERHYDLLSQQHHQRREIDDNCVLSPDIEVDDGSLIQFRQESHLSVFVLAYMRL
jgi:hypothetical protein